MLARPTHQSQTEGTIPNSFSEVYIVPMSHFETQPRKKYRTISLMNMDVKSLHKNIYKLNQRPLKFLYKITSFSWTHSNREKVPPKGILTSH